MLNLLNKECNKRCFILCNGPSLSKFNLSYLKREVVIGMNASTILEKKYYFKQKYYCLSDARFLNSESKRKYATDKLAKETTRVLREELKKYDDPSLCSRTLYVSSLGCDGFSTNIYNGFYFGCTTTMLAIQLASTLGCNKIYLLGLDLNNYFSKKIRFYSEKIPDIYDLFISTQIYNISTAFIELKKIDKSIYHCNRKSIISPYIPFKNYYSLFDNDCQKSYK